MFNFATGFANGEVCLSRVKVGIDRSFEIQFHAVMVRDGSQFMLPFVIASTTLLGGATLLELFTQGAVQSPDNAWDIYMAIMTAYGGAGELKGWRQSAEADAWAEPDSAADRWMDRARKGGFFVGFWLVVYALAYLLRLKDAAYPMPHELRNIVLGMISLFFVTYGVRTIRRGVNARRFLSRDENSGEPDGAVSDAGLLAVIATQTTGMSMKDVIARFPQVSRRTVSRTVARLVDEGRLQRLGAVRSPDVKYKVIG